MAKEEVVKSANTNSEVDLQVTFEFHSSQHYWFKIYQLILKDILYVSSVDIANILISWQSTKIDSIYIEYP